MVTYWWLLLFTVYKGSLVVSALIDWVGFTEFAAAIWTNSLLSSHPEEPPPKVLTEPDVNVSIHPAPPIQCAHTTNPSA